MNPDAAQLQTWAIEAEYEPDKEKRQTAIASLFAAAALYRARAVKAEGRLLVLQETVTEGVVRSLNEPQLAAPQTSATSAEKPATLVPGWPSVLRLVKP